MFLHFVSQSHFLGNRRGHEVRLEYLLLRCCCCCCCFVSFRSTRGSAARRVTEQRSATITTTTARICRKNIADTEVISYQKYLAVENVGEEIQNYKKTPRKNKQTRPDTRHKMRLVCVLFTFGNNTGRTDGRTDGHDL